MWFGVLSGVCYPTECRPNGVPAIPLNIDAAVKDYLSGLKRAFAHDRSQTVGASEIGLCARRIGLEKKLGSSAYDSDYAPPSGAAQRGNILEDAWTTPLMHHAVNTQLESGQLLWAGSGEQRTFEVKEWRLSATPDGMVVGADRTALTKCGIPDLGENASFLVEMKSHDPRLNMKDGPKPAHLAQLNVQIGLVRELTEYKPSYGVIATVDASFLDKTRLWPHRFERHTFLNQIVRAKDIYDTEDPMTLRPEGMIAGGKECSECPYFRKCTGYADRIPAFGDTSVDIKTLPRGARGQIIKYAGTVLNTGRQIRALKEEQRTAEYLLREEMLRANVANVKGEFRYGAVPNFQVAWRKTNGRTTWDGKGMAKFIEANGLDASPFKSKTKGSDRMSVKPIDGDDELEDSDTE